MHFLNLVSGREEHVVMKIISIAFSMRLRVEKKGKRQVTIITIYILKHSCSAGLLLPLKAKYSVPARLLNSERASIDLDIFGPNVLNDIHVVSAMDIYR